MHYRKQDNLTCDQLKKKIILHLFEKGLSDHRHPV